MDDSTNNSSVVESCHFADSTFFLLRYILISLFKCLNNASAEESCYLHDSTYSSQEAPNLAGG